MSYSVSASQINTFVECPRKWAFSKLEKIKTPTQRNALVGERVHKILEDWLSKGVAPDPEERLVIDNVEFHPGRSAYGGMHHLPPPGQHLDLEGNFHMRHWTGRVDFAWASLNNQYVMPVHYGVEGVIPGIGDHKTTGSKNFQYALDEETLRTDAQGIIYANAILEHFPLAKETDLLWVYYSQHKPHVSKKVHLRVHRDESRYRLEPLDKLAVELIKLRGSDRKAADLPPNLDSCKKYGGCPHISYCPVSGVERLRVAMNMNGQTPSNLPLDQQIALATQQAAGANAASAQVPQYMPQAPAIAQGEWVAHTTPGYEWNTATREIRQIYVAQQLPVIQAQPPVIQAQLAPPPMQTAPAMQAAQSPITFTAGPPTIHGLPTTPQGVLPPIVMIGPDGLPFGSVNAPEGVGQPLRLEPVATATTADELDGMKKEQLVALATSIGLDVKRLREPGVREKIRAARAAGVQVGAAPVAAQTSFGTGAVPTASIPAEDIFGTSTGDRITQVVCVLLPLAWGSQTTPKQLVDYARSVVAEIES